jgi:PIN domain nuclease of toxin-antitoxin system
VNGETALLAQAIQAIAEAQRDGALFVSPMSGWELGLAVQKSPGPGRPDLGGQTVRQWFKDALKLTGARLAPINRPITFEAADVPVIYGRKDPGDCFLIATARVRRIPIVTRDGAMRDLARDRPDYLSVIAC